MLGVLVLATVAPRRASRIPRRRHHPCSTDNEPDLACCTPRSLPCQAAGSPCSLGNTIILRVARGAPTSGLVPTGVAPVTRGRYVAYIEPCLRRLWRHLRSDIVMATP
ncbi:hypothetical protein P171DRAFT_25655 [Karstenula rhodostoma CBS 690.94]|uniref:Uncharacterized protein n=1 Tax=Karstenula rhodostoma CBS 690.94 TaxID=1392251 RepID=A0A9P4PIT3_9PLEO|nr:hypothetical protein P171DRAFT_25655 [Karstenula rhodostoma CBS 690.94]